MMSYHVSIALAASLAVFASLSCARQAKPTSADESIGGGVDLAGMDRTVAPGDDFFLFANGAWIQRTEIPADRSGWGVNAVLAELTTRRTSDLIAEIAATPSPAGSQERKIGDYYSSFMDEAAIEAAGLEPLGPTLGQIAAIADGRALARFLGGTVRADVDVLNNTKLYTDNIFGLWVAQDLDRPQQYSPFILQGGLGMPDRDFYVDPSQRMADIRAKYRAHIASMLRLVGAGDAEGKAQRIFDLEQKIAEVHATRVESEDVLKGNNHWSRGDFDSKAPGLDWQSFFSAAGLDKQEAFVAWQPRAITGISTLVRSQPLVTWKDYLTFHAVEHAGGFLPRAFVGERFAFHGKVLTGALQLRDRWKRAADATDAALGEAVGKLYVARYFPPAAKARVEEMVRNEIAAFRSRIDRLPWMNAKTKERAKAKVAVLKVGVGYPNKWRDYSGLEVRRGDAFGNFQRAELFEYQRNVRKLAQEVDRDEWVMNPQLVNAVNLPAMNALNFPAAMLQPPHFDPGRPIAMDYGAVGAVIGHEISHSFDDQGALFDEHGRLDNWWTEGDLAHFHASAERLVKQYDAYRPFPDLAVNGKLTLSENLADLAGLAAAYDAYRHSLAGKEAPVVEGLTGDQQFFISFAQAWRSKLREPALRQRIVVDAHAPAHYRVLTVRNVDAWYEAFDVTPGQALYLTPEQRVRVW